MIPEISVIIPVYNAEQYLSRCIESIINQSFHNFELILINDGSKDKSGEICNSFLKKDCRIKVVHKENGGVTSARKRGWIESNGNWIVFVDADDILLSEGLSILYNEAIKYNCDIVKASIQSQPSGRLWIHNKLGTFEKKDYVKTFIYNQTFGIPVASIYNRYIIDESVFEIDQSIKIGEDVLMNIEIALKIKNARNISDIIYHYTDNIDSVMNQKIRHPFYYERYYNLMFSLLKKEDDLLNEEDFAKLKYEESKAILCSLYCPDITISWVQFKKYQMNLKEISYKLECDYKIKLFGYSIKYIFLFVILKSIIALNYKFKNFRATINSTQKKEILY